MPNPPAPALSDAGLSETLDLLSTLVASVSDRMDSQTQAIDRLTRTATEARQAAFTARAQTDPALFAEYAATQIGERLHKALDMLLKLIETTGEQNRDTLAISVIDRDAREALMERIRKEKAEAERWKQRIPFMASLGLVLALGLGIALAALLPRFMALDILTCGIMGGQVMVNAANVPACVFIWE